MLSRNEISPEACERQDETLLMWTDGPRASDNIGFVVKPVRGLGIIVPSLPSSTGSAGREPDGSGRLYFLNLDNTDLSFRVRSLCGTVMLTFAFGQKRIELRLVLFRC